LTTNTFYYGKLTRDESVGTYGELKLQVYSDANFTTLIQTLTITLTEKQDFRYLLLGNVVTANNYGLIEYIDIITP
jgi:hypothetical protein